jgi:hypothetical protein
VAGHRLELGSEAVAPLLDEMSFVDNEVLKQTGFRGVFEWLAQSPDECLGRSEYQALLAGADILTELPLDVFGQATDVCIASCGAWASLRFHQRPGTAFHVEGKNDGGNNDDGDAGAPARQDGRGLDDIGLPMARGQANDHGTARLRERNRARGLPLPDRQVPVASGAEGFPPEWIARVGLKVAAVLCVSPKMYLSKIHPSHRCSVALRHRRMPRLCCDVQAAFVRHHIAVDLGPLLVRGKQRVAGHDEACVVSACLRFKQDLA